MTLVTIIKTYNKVFVYHGVALHDSGHFDDVLFMMPFGRPIILNVVETQQKLDKLPTNLEDALESL